MYIIIAAIAFGLLIAVHELGHFIAAKLMDVRVLEFAIGLGPKILKKQGKETLYSLRVFPFGGFCAMEEDEEARDPRSFSAKSRKRRVFILAAGGVANFLAAFIITVIVVTQMSTFTGTTIAGFADGFPGRGENGLMPGDRIVSINGERLYYAQDFLMFMQLERGSHVDLVIRRDGERIRLNSFPLEPREYLDDGVARVRYGIDFIGIENSVWEGFKYSCYMTINFVRLVRISLAQLISGAVGVRDLTGPVGMVDMMNTVGQAAPTVTIALENIAHFVALIGVNIAVINLLPIPAMDGGRIFLLFVTWIIEKMTRRRVDPKYEGYIHQAALVLLVCLMVFVLINDVARIVSG